MENHAGDRRVTEETLSELAKRNSKKRIKYLEKIFDYALKKQMMTIKQRRSPNL